MEQSLHLLDERISVRRNLLVFHQARKVRLQRPHEPPVRLGLARGQLFDCTLCSARSTRTARAGYILCVHAASTSATRRRGRSPFVMAIAFAALIAV
ncbi:hypothetical protein FA95DRAFT_1560394, partial [Auriscalpium vulgare]